MIKRQSKIIWHTENQENMGSDGERQLVQVNAEITQMLELSDNDRVKLSL